jgi:hypothetical protein
MSFADAVLALHSPMPTVEGCFSQPAPVYSGA